MAQATIQGQIVDNRRVILDISMNEAIALRTLTGSVVGCMKTSIRKHTDSVCDTLKDIGIKSLNMIPVSGNHYITTAEFKPILDIDRLSHVVNAFQ